MNLQKINSWNWLKHEYDVVSEEDKSSTTHNTCKNPPGVEYRQKPLLLLYHEMDKLFDTLFNTFDMPPLHPCLPIHRFIDGKISNVYRPNIDISGDEETYQITLDVPGFSESELFIEVKGDVMTINGEKEAKSESKNMQFYRIERNYGSFQRTLSLPDDANVDDIKANLKDGVLKLQIPRCEIERKDVKRISITS